jgi:hypothetical protein
MSRPPLLCPNGHNWSEGNRHTEGFTFRTFTVPNHYVCDSCDERWTSEGPLRTMPTGPMPEWKPRRATP